MAEIKRKPFVISIRDPNLPQSEDTVAVYTAFDDDHTVADIMRWLISEGCFEPEDVKNLVGTLE